MPFRYTDTDRHAYLGFLDQMGIKWVELFAGDTAFYSAAYWDLLTFLWRNPDPVRKTDAQASITGIKSPLTAAKYVETAIKRGGCALETAGLIASAPRAVGRVF